ncbi:3-ketoacyl-ACP reductase [Paenibacillus hunanensis]|uniref:3-oxoacyl-[acyl-carrier protein] reductase n=1 Tax=Paenibacillus hunanensis TaxID=539262 RepID=A0ABU1IWN7_9BACL|nr:3-ketoacyl-ACP reductase [Paenibacillus hunanensis]MCL9661664.1 3-ketoacyl-ACP reductase [Paenibacillus hunanensis]MDR6242802.1 3-oxoacyl-[acyl-carrier protein] reductase [Paenibacillus hunanensis]WPP41842.1 3-ketoacyl-ACP reductase [Paenibacillus hunanensis]GGJ02835.1 3-ketoacyl-ACP reductase [Paenibacillus hunanensis]
MELTNKTAIITGAGKGIGKATAEALAAEGVQLGLLARTASDLEQLQQDLSSRYGVKVFTATADVANSTEVRAAVSSLASSLGRVDILINNAGTGAFAKMVDMDPEQWEQIIRVNLMGAYYVTHELLPGMLEQQSGDIVNIASTAGERGFATGSAYCASKFALLGMTEALMQEVRKSNIRVTALTPSTVNTPLAVNAGLPIGDEDRMMQAEDVAQLVLAGLKLPSRVVLKSAGIWTNNPQ